MVLYFELLKLVLLLEQGKSAPPGAEYRQYPEIVSVHSLRYLLKIDRAIVCYWAPEGLDLNPSETSVNDLRCSAR